MTRSVPRSGARAPAASRMARIGVVSENADSGKIIPSFKPGRSMARMPREPATVASAADRSRLSSRLIRSRRSGCGATMQRSLWLIHFPLSWLIVTLAWHLQERRRQVPLLQLDRVEERGGLRASIRAVDDDVPVVGTDGLCRRHVLLKILRHPKRLLLRTNA